MDQLDRGRCSTWVEWGWLFLVVAVPLVFTRSVYNHFAAPKVALFRAVVEGMLCVALLCLPRTRAFLPERLRSLRSDPLSLALLLYAAVLVAATLAGRDLTVGVWGLYLRWMGAFTLLHGVVLAALVARLLRREEQLRRLLGAIALGALPVAALAVAQRLGWDQSQWTGNEPVNLRSVSTLGNASLLGSYLVWALPFTAAWAFSGGTARRGAGLAAVMLQLAALVTTMTRGAWLGAAAAMLLFFGLLLWHTRRRRWVLAGMAAFGVLATAVGALNFAPLLAGRVENPVIRRLASFRETDPRSSGGSRLLYWQGVLAGGQESLPAALLGYGPQSFAVVHSRRYAPIEADLGDLGQFPDSSHNLLLDLLNDVGLLGALAWLSVLAAAVLAPFRALRRPVSPTARLVSAAVLAGIAGYLVQGLFLFEHVVSLMFFAVAAGAGASPALHVRAGSEGVAMQPSRARRPRSGPARGSRRTPASARSNAPERRPSFWVAGPAAIALLALLYVGNARPLWAEWLKMEAIHATRQGDADTARALLERAARAAPWEPAYELDLAELAAGRAVMLRQAAPGDRTAIDESFRAAESHLRRALAADAGDVRVYHQLGILSHLWGETDPARYADAARSYARAAALSPRRQRTYWLWGDLLLAQGKTREAEARYRQALALGPHVAAAHGAMATLYDRLGRPAAAERHRQTARSLRPTALVVVPHAPPGARHATPAVQ